MTRLPIFSRLAADESLLRKVGAGDHKAFEQLYLRHKDRLFNFIVHALPQPAAAEEIAQDVWEAVFRQAAHFERRTATFKTWLYRIASHKVTDVYRRKVNWTEELPALEEPQEQLSVEDRILVEQLLEALGQLPMEQRITFLLAQQGFSHYEIAEMTGVGSETVKSRVRYAKAGTRKTLEVHIDRA